MKRVALLLALVLAALVFLPAQASARDRHDRRYYSNYRDHGRYYNNCSPFGGRAYYGRSYYRPYYYAQPVYYTSSYYRPAYYSGYRSYGYGNRACYPRTGGFRISIGF